MRFPTCFAWVFVSVAASSSAFAAGSADGEASSVPAPAANHPPKFVPSAPLVWPTVRHHGGGSAVLLRSGRSVRMTMTAEDPNGDVLTYSARPLPPGSSFDTQKGVFTWLPAREQEGRHSVDFEVTDGRHVTSRAIVFVVSANRAPYAPEHDAFIRVARAKRSSSSGPLASAEHPGSAVLAVDEDRDELSVTPRSLPRGASITSSDGQVHLSYEPEVADVGVHELVVEVSDGELTTTIRRRLVALPEWAESDHHRYLLLGGGPAAFLAHDDGELLVGGAVDISLAALVKSGVTGFHCSEGTRTRECRPSHRRFYAEFEVLDSLRHDAPSLFTYGFGYSAGFEYFPGRRAFIPHYGIELGGLYREGLGHRVQTRPYLGLHLWAGERLWLNATLGYRVVPAELHDFSGPTAVLRAVVYPW